MAKRELCIDTNILIDYLKGREPVASALTQVVKTHNCFVTSITTYELLFGVTRAKKEIGEHDLLGAFSPLAFDRASASRASLLHTELLSLNKNIGLKDIFIASICLVHGLPILTSNVKHFSRVPNLNIITPAEILTRQT